MAGKQAFSGTANDRSDSGKLHVDSDRVQSYVAHIEKMKQKLFPVVGLNIKKAQKKQMAYYSPRYTSQKYLLGYLVLVENVRTLNRKGGRWHVLTQSL